MGACAVGKRSGAFTVLSSVCSGVTPDAGLVGVDLANAPLVRRSLLATDLLGPVEQALCVLVGQQHALTWLQLLDERLIGQQAGRARRRFRNAFVDRDLADVKRR